MQDVYLMREDFHKLNLIAFVEGDSRAAVSRNMVCRAIKKYEKENGNLLKLAEEALINAK